MQNPNWEATKTIIVIIIIIIIILSGNLSVGWCLWFLVSLIPTRIFRIN